MLYFTTYNTTYAVDASTCALKWKYSRPGPAGGLGVNRGAAYLDGKLFRGTGDAHIFALDAATGKPAWDATLGDPASGDSVPMAPLAWNGMVFAGNAGGDNFAVTGRIYALSAADGHQLWRFNVVPDSGPARATWKNLSDRNPPTGGATWTSYSLDPEAGVLWVSTGNVAPDFLLALHPGDNLYTTSVIALDAKTGTLLRYVQPVKNDFHDWDMTVSARADSNQGRTPDRRRRRQRRNPVRHRSLRRNPGRQVFASAAQNRVMRRRSPRAPTSKSPLTPRRKPIFARGRKAVPNGTARRFIPS